MLTIKSEMTNEEVDKYSGAVLLAASESVGFPESVRKVSHTSGGVGFEFNFHSNDSKGQIIYSPQPYIEKLVRLASSEMFNREKSDDLSDGPVELVKEIWEIHIQGVARAILRIMFSELWETADLIPYIAIRTVSHFNYSAERLRQSDEESKNFVNQLVAEISSQRKKRILALKKEVSETVIAPPHVFFDVYQILLRSWQEAKKFYNQNKKRSNCLEIVKFTFPDLPKDLVDEFNAYDSYRSQAATLAFTHAGRVCMLGDLYMAKTTKASYLSEAKKQRANISDADALAERIKFFSTQKEMAVETERLLQIIRESVGNNLE